MLYLLIFIIFIILYVIDISNILKNNYTEITVLNSLKLEIIYFIKHD